VRALSKPFTVAMRQGDWKVLANEDLTRFELYNLARYLAEEHDMTRIEPTRLAQMKKTLKTLHTQIAAEAPQWPNT
jgi:hypothetical protein